MIKKFEGPSAGAEMPEEKMKVYFDAEIEEQDYGGIEWTLQKRATLLKGELRSVKEHKRGFLAGSSERPEDKIENKLLGLQMKSKSLHPDDWDNKLKNLNSYEQSLWSFKEKLVDYVDLATYAKILSPEKFQKINLGESSKEILKLFEITTYSAYFDREYSHYREYYKERILSSELTKEQLPSWLLSDHGSQNIHDRYRILSDFAYTVAMTAPGEVDKFRESLKLNEGEIEQLWQKSVERKSPLYERLEILSIIKLIYPEVFKKLNLSESDWQHMKDQLRKYKDEGDLDSFVEHAAKMKILAAKKVEMTDKGLEMVMPEQEKKEK